VAAVVQTKITRHPGEHDAIGLAESLAALVTYVQRVIAPEQPTCHARQVHGDSQLLDRRRDLRRGGGAHNRLAADHQAWSLGLGNRCHCRPQACVRNRRQSHRARCKRRVSSAAGEQSFDMTLEVEARQAIGHTGTLAASLSVPAAHAHFVIEHIDGALDEHRSRDPMRATAKAFLTAGASSRTR
jgi:hypothetical protein